MYTYDYKHNDLDLEIEYTYDPGEPDQWYDSNGDPGTPGYGPSVEIEHIWCELPDGKGNTHYVDIMDVFFDEYLEGAILESHE